MHLLDFGSPGVHGVLKSKTQHVQSIAEKEPKVGEKPELK